MSTIFQRVAKFNKDAGTQLNRNVLEQTEWNNELGMLIEEVEELRQAFVNDQDRVEIADALGDIIYVAMGTMAKLGINYEKVMDEICKSNETKYQDGQLVKNEQGKIQKGPNFKTPDLSFTAQVEELKLNEASQKDRISVSGVSNKVSPAVTTTFKVGG